MAVIDFNEPAANNTNNGAGNAQQRPQAKTWLNIGGYMPFKQSDGTVEQVLVGTPVGMPLDTQQPMKGNSVLAKRKNGLLDKLQKAAMTVEPGEHAILSHDVEKNIVIWVTRVSDQASVPSDDDQAAIDAVQINFG